MNIYETITNEEIINTLISLSEAWEEENSCYCYRDNKKEDIEGNRVFLAEEDGEVVGYLLGKGYGFRNIKLIMTEGTS